MTPAASRSRLLRLLRRWGMSALAAGFLALATIDALPLSPPALREALQPVIARLGLAQPWYVFAPQPDSVNTRLQAEIVYADGKRATWRSPDWSQHSRWERWKWHRRAAWIDGIWGQEDAAVWPGWARYLAGEERKEVAQAHRGAEVKLIVRQSQVPPAGIKPWASFRTPPPLDEEWVLSHEKLP